MWHFDWQYSIYSSEEHRKISVAEYSKLEELKKTGIQVIHSTWYTLVEEWATDEGIKHKSSCDYYRFFSYEEASVFLVNLAVRLNTPAQQVLMQAAEDFASEITKKARTKSYLKKATKEQENSNAVVDGFEELNTHVYCVLGDHNRCKIGYTTEVNQR